MRTLLLGLLLASAFFFAAGTSRSHMASPDRPFLWEQISFDVFASFD